MLNVNLCCACFAHSYHTIRSAAETEKADAKEATAKQVADNTANAAKLDRVAKIGFDNGTLRGARNAVVAAEAAASTANNDNGVDCRAPCLLFHVAVAFMWSRWCDAVLWWWCSWFDAMFGSLFRCHFLILMAFPALTPV